MPSPISSLHVVTNSFHLPRSLLIFSSVFPPTMSIAPAACPNGARLLEDTAAPLEQWEAQEAKQLALLRSENGSEVGNLLARCVRSA